MSKIEDLEVRIAFQEETIDILSDRVSQQDKHMARMEIQLHHLMNKLKEIVREGASSNISSHNEVPPHY